MAAFILLVSILGILMVPRLSQAQERIGCFIFNHGNTVLSVRSQRVGSIQACIQRCQTHRATYAGIRYGYQCYCGDNHDHQVNGQQLSDGRCTTTCNDHTRRCGGVFSIVIYSVCNRGRYRDNTNNEYNCDASCNCEDSNICLYNTGSCPANCKSGWSGDACNVKVYMLTTQYTTIQSESKRLASSDRVPAQERIGCFSFNHGNTVLSVKTQDVGSIEECIQQCKSRRATYAGIRYGYQCYCGDNHDHQVNGQQLSDRRCTTTCNDRTRRCGGLFSIVIYSVCSRGRYRDNTIEEPNCGASCNCADDHICLYNTGSCPSSCQTGGSGKACNARAQERIGCFSFNHGNTVLSVKTQDVGSIEECIQHCQSRSVTYAGIRFGFQCYCGDNHDHQVNGEQLSDSSCTTRCNDQTQRCGGQFSIVIYSVCSRGRYRDNTIEEPNCGASCNCKDNHVCLYNTGSCPAN